MTQVPMDAAKRVVKIPLWLMARGDALVPLRTTLVLPEGESLMVLMPS